eukprot:6187726-Amphidinium_carterae.1
MDGTRKHGCGSPGCNFNALVTLLTRVLPSLERGKFFKLLQTNEGFVVTSGHSVSEGVFSFQMHAFALDFHLLKGVVSMHGMSLCKRGFSGQICSNGLVSMRGTPLCKGGFSTQ